MIRALALLAGLCPAVAAADCRQALVLALDVSGSVDAREYALQQEGVATALSSPPVRAALLSPGQPPIRLAVFEWSGPKDQAMVLPWITIADAASLDRAIARIRGHQRVPQSPTTAIGAAMETGFAMLAQQPACWRHTLDISGDGEANTGPRPQFVAPPPAPPGIIVNGLVIGTADGAVPVADLAAYFRAYVLRGPGAFVETALGFEDYARAMEAKLLRELLAIAVGSAARD